MLQFDVRYLVCVFCLLYLTQSVAVRTEVGVAITAEKVNATGKEGMVQQGIEVAYVVGGVTYGVVSVVDVTTNTIIDTFSKETTSSSFEEVVVASDGARAYVRNRALPDTIEVIDTATNDVLAPIPIKAGASKLAVSPDGARVYVMNGGSYDLTFIDTVTNQVRIVPVGDTPTDMVVSPDGTRVYVITEGVGARGNVRIIDTATNQVMAPIPIGFSPSGILVTPDGSRVYIINNPLLGVGNRDIRVIDTVTNEVVRIISVGTPGGSKPNMVITPDGARVYVSVSINLGDVVLFVDTAKNEVTDTVLLSTFYANHAGEMILSLDGTRICIICREGIWIVDTGAKQLIDTILMRRPNRIAFTSDGAKVYGIGLEPSSLNRYSISRIDMTTHGVTYTSVNFIPQAITIARINQ
jgi:YVTN family beta-propeller protein